MTYGIFCINNIGLPVNLEDVEIVGTRIIGTDGKLSTVYRFRIMRHATWEYVLQVKAANPSLCFFKCQENMLFAVYQTGERKICIRPFDRNEVFVVEIEVILNFIGFIFSSFYLL